MRFSGIIILLLLAANTSAQLTDSLAGMLLQQEKVYWLAKEDTARYGALLSKARLERGAGLYSDALNELYRAEDMAHTNREKATLSYEKMLNYFLSDDYYACSIISIDSGAGLPDYKEHVFMKICAFNEAEKWDSCKVWLLKMCSPKDTLDINKIRTLPIAYKYKNPIKSKKMSNILPGLGEIYAGYPFKGFTSFVLNAGFLFFASYNYYLGYYVTGSVSGIFPLLKFHAGGKRLSYMLACKHNEKESRRIKNKYWEEISSLEQ